MSAARKHLEVVTETAKQSRSILSPGWDIFFMGGLAVAMYLLMCVSFQRNAPDNNIALWVFNLSFLFNFPHFLVSYQLLYGDFRHEILRNRRFFWAAICVPLILGGGLVAAFWNSSPATLGFFLNAMYFFVGWHYVKQTFGAVVVTNAMKKMFYNSSERFWLMANMYSLWAVSFCAMNTNQHTYAQMGVTYYSLNFPEWPLQISYAALVVSVLGVVATHVAKYVREGQIPTTTGMIAYAVIYIFLLPAMSHPYYAHMIPLFHSFQYLIFVFAFRRNKTESQVANANSPDGRLKMMVGVWGYLMGAIALGALAFQLIPGYFDGLSLINRAVFGATPFVFFSTVFINIHHYFIDNVIWKGSNPEIKKHLFKVA